LGGDEFIVMLNRTDADAATIVADKLNHVLSKPFQFGEYRMEITCSIGIAIFPDSGLNASDLLRHADIAMYQAKKSGKDRYTLFSNQLHYVQHQRHNIIKKDLKHAAARNQLTLEYQPQFNLADGKIIGFEALLRWNHPDQGLIFPAEFIPLAEQTGTISTIGQWAIEQAISDFSKFILPLHPKAKLSLNVSLMQISDARFLDTLCDSLASYSLSNDYLILDVSEHIMATSMKEIYKALDDIHERGIKISLDNFGGPHVSLSKLLELPIDYIKLDQRLLYGMEDHDKQRQLLAGILELANKLNLHVIQKGIENLEQSEILKSLGYELVQGYHYCQPVDINELQKFLKAYHPEDMNSVKS
jgi:predicted signal transduction protein with EAL and GGDEF domain